MEIMDFLILFINHIFSGGRVYRFLAVTSFPFPFSFKAGMEGTERDEPFTFSKENGKYVGACRHIRVPVSNETFQQLTDSDWNAGKRTLLLIGKVINF
jgi:hypothetical protein